MLRVRDRDERLITREIDHVSALPVLVQAPRGFAIAHEVDRRSLVTRRPAEDSEATPERETGAVGRLELRGHGHAFPAAERLADVAPELVPFCVVEPPDVLAQEIETARDTVAGPLGAIGDLSMRSDEPAPGVNLEAPAGIR